MNAQHKQLSEQLLAQTSTLCDARLVAIEPLAGDASGREFFRIRLEDSPVSTAVLLIPGKTSGPVSSAGDEYLQDETYLHLGKFLRAEGIQVPEIYAADGAVGAFLVEDIGDLPLWHFPFEVQSKSANAVSQLLGTDALVILFEKAIDVIAELQSIAPAQSCLAYRRELGYAQLLDESMRFVTFYATPEKFRKSEISVITAALEKLCSSLSRHPQTLIHRDYMPWNIHVTAQGSLRIIDFQDACLGPSLYDLISLLHDRDVDLKIKDDRIGQLLAYYRQKLNEPDDFLQRYFETILQRHFRLAGQFRRLTEKTGREVYANWVPGCLERLGRTLARLPEWAEVLGILSSKSPDARKGAASPWPF